MTIVYRWVHRLFILGASFLYEFILFFYTYYRYRRGYMTFISLLWYMSFDTIGEVYV